MIVNFKTFQTELGWFAATYTNSPFQLLKIYLPLKTRKDIILSINKDLKAEENYHSNIETIVNNVLNFLQGQAMVKIPWSWLYLSSLTKLQVKTLEQTTKIPYGTVCTYKELAQKINNPKASRFVGSCMAKNPFPIIIPCHRVVRSDGNIGQFRGGTALKKKILKLEGVETVQNKILSISI